MKRSVCMLLLAAIIAACSTPPPAKRLKPASESPAEHKRPSHSSPGRTALAQKSPAVPAAAEEPGAVRDALLEDAVLCKKRLSLFGYEKHLRDANLIDREDNENGTRLFLPIRPMTVLGKRVGKLVLAGDDESDYAQLLILLNSSPDAVASLVRSRHIKLARHAGSYRSTPQRHGVVLISGQGNITTISCGRQVG